MADQPKAPTPAKAQTFNLKQSESNTLRLVQNNYQASFAALLSLIAQDRMGYTITERTQFKLDADLTTMEISEIPEEVPVAGAPEKPQAPEAPKSGVVTSK